MALELIKADTYGAIEWVYPKEEADKVIAEKDAEIARLKEQVSEERSAKVDYKISANDLSDGLEKAYAEIRHQKYKRCLANAWWCLREEFFAEDCHCEHWVDWAIKWYKRWLKIAEKFKE